MCETLIVIFKRKRTIRRPFWYILGFVHLFLPYNFYQMRLLYYLSVNVQQSKIINHFRWKNAPICLKGVMPLSDDVWQ